jgi:hypothetical protein
MITIGKSGVCGLGVSGWEFTLQFTFVWLRPIRSGIGEQWEA